MSEFPGGSLRLPMNTAVTNLHIQPAFSYFLAQPHEVRCAPPAPNEHEANAQPEIQIVFTPPLALKKTQAKMSPKTRSSGRIL